MNGDNDQIRRMQSVLRDFKSLLDRLKNHWRQTASRFNVVEAFGVTRDELAHSQFIAYLLNPLERHDQGDIFLTSFLQCLDLTYSLASTQSASVNTEIDLGSYGRIDIHIRLANGQIILLENKVGEPEGHCQIARYQKWLQRQGAPPGFPHQLVFLTPEGRRPESTRKPKEVICLSYLRLADWISSSQQAIEQAERLRVILEQYAETCRHIGGSTRRNAMPDEIRQIFLDPERLETALEIEKHLPGFKRWLHKTFWREVAEVRLTELLKNNDPDPLWEIQFQDPLFQGFNFGNSQGWRIAWREACGQPHFSVKAEFDPRKGLFYGITRGVGIPEANQVPQDKDIRNRLKEKGFAQETDHFLGRRFFRDLGLPRFDLSRVDDVLELAREMQNDDRPLTHRVVELIWELFCDFRQELEALNRKYPYDPPADANA